MEYIVPAWHSRLKDWAYNVPSVEVYDGENFLRVLGNNKEVGLVITDYQPQLSTKLNDTSLYPDKIFSIYDYLQDIHGLNGQVLDYRDFAWPDDIVFDFTPFRILAVSQGRLYAKIIFDTMGKVLWISYLGADGKEKYKLFLDSRGFVSSKDTDHDTTYYDPLGHWRFIVEKADNSVKINPNFDRFKQTEYESIDDLIQEVFIEKFLHQVDQADHIITTLDDQSPISNRVYKGYNVIYSVNHSCTYQKRIREVEAGQVIVPAKRDICEVKKELPKDLPITVMPSFPVQIKLGHSQRIRRQITAIFAEHMSYEELKQIVSAIYPRLINNPENEGLRLLTYSNEKFQISNRVIQELKQEYQDEFSVKEDVEKQGDNRMERSQSAPILMLETKRLTSTADAFKALDKVRILINWSKSDDFIQTAAIGVGVPQLQNFASSTLVDHKNGLLCYTPQDVVNGISAYLDDLNAWNQALVYDVKLLNQYSEENLMKIWQKLLKDGD